ncbi:MAG: exonuclease domain-containing protein [Clostridiales bacterium]|nr:exonuclease domain-containing protein [Clostridiales bacterium]
MYYVMMDFEWNTAYAYKRSGFINEIIEIGAVVFEYDNGIRIIDRYSEFIKPKVTKKLTGRVKELTHISNTDLKTGKSFAEAIFELTSMVGRNDYTVMTWGTTDITTLLDNCRYFMGLESIPFLKNYMDAQSFCQKKLDIPGNNQISLSAAAEKAGIDISEFSAHRAYEDSMVAALCLEKCFDAEEIAKRTSVCDDAFYRKITFKKYKITDVNDPNVHLDSIKAFCPDCNKEMRCTTKWRLKFGGTFYSVYKCPVCGKTYNVNVTYTRYADKVTMKQRQTPTAPKKEA